MSPFHFAVNHQGVYGLAPHQFVIRCRGGTGKGTLVQGRMAIAGIATEAGLPIKAFISLAISNP